MSQLAANFDLILQQGSDEEVVFVLFDVMPVAVLTANGVTYSGGVLTNLTNVTFRAQFRPSVDLALIEAQILPSMWSTEPRDWGVYGTLTTVVGTLPIHLQL